MSLATLLNRNLTIVRRSDSGDVDTYGNTVFDETLIDVVGELQQQQRGEPTGEEFSDTTWRLFLPAGTALDANDVVLVDDQEFEVIGEPWAARNPRTRIASHVEATLRRVGVGAGGS